MNYRSSKFIILTSLVIATISVIVTAATHGPSFASGMAVVFSITIAVLGIAHKYIDKRESLGGAVDKLLMAQTIILTSSTILFWIVEFTPYTGGGEKYYTYPLFGLLAAIPTTIYLVAVYLSSERTDSRATTLALIQSYIIAAIAIIIFGIPLVLL